MELYPTQMHGMFLKKVSIMIITEMIFDTLNFLSSLNILNTKVWSLLKSTAFLLANDFYIIC